MVTNNINERNIALNIVVDVLENGKFSHIVMKNTLDELSKSNQDCSKKTKAFITRLSEGTIEKMITLDYIIDGYSKIKVKKMKPVIRNILRLSVYQVYFMDNIPESAICNEAVKIAKKRGFTNLTGFVNGILRNIIRTKADIKLPEKENLSTYLSVKYSEPVWIVNHFLNNYGKDKTQSIFEGMEKSSNNNEMSVRVNKSIISIDEVVNLLKSQQITVRYSDICNDALIISNFTNVESILAFQKGYIQIQDLSSMLVGVVSGVKKDDFCIDVCAAPGGKSLHIADKLMNTGHVEARDLSDKKVKLIKDNIKRTGLYNIEAIVSDALVEDKESINKADVVIADVPCSGLGVMAKKSDIKYKLKEEQLRELSILSQNILNNVVKYVKRGGVLIFSTCTINPTENEDNRKYIIDNLGFEPVSIENDLTDAVLEMDENRKTAKEGYVQIFTNEHMDGFFISKFRKK